MNTATKLTLVALFATLLAPLTGNARDREQEPNDDAQSAQLLDQDRTLSGQFDNKADRDFIAFDIEPGALHRWRVQVAGEGVRELVLHDPGGNPLARTTRSGKLARISSLQLPPGRYVVALKGNSGRYLFRVIDQGPAPAPTPTPASLAAADGPAPPPAATGPAPDPAPPPVTEIEPNDSPGTAMALTFGDRHSGLLDRNSDLDSYRFTLAGPTRIALVLEPSDHAIRADLQRYWGSKAGTPMRIAIPAADPAPSPVAAGLLTWQGLLPAGDYLLVLKGSKVTETPYALTLLHQPWFDRPADLEPNDTPDQARPIPEDGQWNGLFTDRVDWFALPVSAQEKQYRLTQIDPPLDQVRVNIRARALKTPAEPGAWNEPVWRSHRQLKRDASGDWIITVPAQARVVIGLSGRHPRYAVKLTGLDAPGKRAGAVDVTLTLDGNQVAAFERRRQSVTGKLTVTNRDSDPIGVRLSAHLDNPQWNVTLVQQQLDLQPSESADIALELGVAPDAWDELPIHLAVAALSRDGAVLASDELPLTADADTPAVVPGDIWPLPDSMLGGLNLAWSALGASVGEKQAKLIDGLPVLQRSLKLGERHLKSWTLEVDLAGDEPVTLNGVMLWHPRGGIHHDQLLRDFRIDASADGTTFSEVLTGRMAAHGDPQPFAFAAPVEARHLRLVPLSNESPTGVTRGVVIGDFKAIGDPQTPAPGGQPINLADPLLGGHIAFSQPWQSLDKLLMRSDRNVALHRPRGGWVEHPAVIIGFRDGRAALIDELQWVAGDEDLPAPVTVSVEASLGSPLGPWRPIAAAWRVSQQGDSQLQAPRPFWARYLRLRLMHDDPDRHVVVPDQLRVLEHPAGAEYRSIAGEWTEQGREAVYEWLHPPQTGETVGDSGDTFETATPLPFGPMQRESVEIDVDQDWRRIDIPEPGGRLELVLAGQASTAVRLTLFDSDRGEIPLTSDRSDPERIRYQAQLPPGAYFAQIVEPPRSMLVVWDTSGSVSAFYDLINSGVTGFAADLVAGRDEANLMPFAPNPALLLEHWTGDQVTLMQALRSYDRRQIDSSNAELAMLRASEELKTRDGVRAILVITDLQSPGVKLNTALWEAFTEARPRVFAVAVPTAAAINTPRRIHELFRDWTAVGAGHLDYLSSEGRISVAFRRAAAWLRRPAVYDLSASLVAGKPEPAQLTVIAAGDVVNTGRAVEVILDGSGSMRQRIDGVPRYRIARDALIALTRDTLPPDIPFALRVFGKGGAGSCRTDLDLPLGPLDPKQVRAAIKGFTPVNLAKTPLGASLAAVEDDLTGSGGELPASAIVILLTDGEETCEGDPGAAIERLRALGIQVELNIVGFAVDDATLAAQFEAWARLGNGRYFQASDDSGLRSALRDAIALRYRVMQGDAVVARGVVNGTPVELPPGHYRIEHDLGASAEIRLPGGARRQLKLEAP